MKNIAFIYSGDETGLQPLKDSRNAIASVISSQKKWEKPINKQLLSLDKLEEDLKIFEDESIQDFIFYFIGHGTYSGKEQTFYLQLTNEKKRHVQDIFNTIFDTLNILPLRISFVFDACFSGKIVFQTDKWNKGIEILTSSLGNEQSSSISPDQKRTLFTYHFCEAIKKHGKMNLSEISEHINDNVSIQESLYDSTIGRDGKMIIANYGDIKTEQLPEDKELFLTIEIVHHYDNMYYMNTWEEWVDMNDATVLKNNSPSDDSYTKEEIPSIIDEFRKSTYPHIKLKDIFLTLVLPSELMTENINFWKLENGQFLGSEYTILLRGRERFVKEGVNKDRKYYDIKKWQDNWDAYIDKKNNYIENTSCPIGCNDDEKEITSAEVDQRPFALMHYTPTMSSFKNLYKSGFPLIMWVNGCKDFTNFQKIFSQRDYKEIKLGNLHNVLFKFKPRHTHIERDASIMLIYDNPELLPYDENAPKLKTPQGETNDN